MKKWLYLLVTAVSLSGCAHKPVHQRSTPPPPVVSTIAVRQAVKTSTHAASAAQTRTETIIRTVETIRETTDPTTAAALGEVQMELFKVSADLREVQESNKALTQAIPVLEKQRDDLTAWGVTQQTVAEANADGWSKEATAHTKTKGDLSHQTGLAWKWRLIAIGGAVAVGAIFVARQYFPFLRFL